MAIDLLTTSGINSFINSYIQTEKSKRITPLKTRQTKYNNLSSAYSSLLSNIDKLKGSLTTLKLRDSSSIFKAKKQKHQLLIWYLQLLVQVLMKGHSLSEQLNLQRPIQYFQLTEIQTLLQQ